MLSWIYTFDYAVPELTGADCDRAETAHHLSVYTVADKYQLDVLKKKALENLRPLLKQCNHKVFVDTMIEIYDGGYGVDVVSEVQERRDKDLPELLKLDTFQQLLRSHPTLLPQLSAKFTSLVSVKLKTFSLCGHIRVLKEGKPNDTCGARMGHSTCLNLISTVSTCWMSQVDAKKMVG